MFRSLQFALFISACLFGQDSRTPSLAGRVLDPSGAAVPAASVKLYSRDHAVERKTVTDAQGAFRFESLPAGEYLMEARTEGLDQSNPVVATVAAGIDARADLRLEIKGLATRVLVTASSTPQSMIEIGKAMDVIDSTELERRQEITFTEAVRLTPGFRVQQLGGPGSMTRILTRGLRAADSGLLIDGMRFRDVAAVQGDATAFFGDLQLVDSNRIEILRGLGSSIYGSNATAGVINLVTDQGGGPVRGELSGEGGGLGLFRGLARVAGGTLEDRLQYSAGMAYLNLNGGVDGVEQVRNTAGQGYVLWRPMAAAALSARLIGTTSTVQINSSPTAAPVANLPAAGTIPAIPLAEEQVQSGDQGRPFVWGNATFGPNFHDPDNRRAGDFLSSLFQWNHQAAPRWNYRLSYHGLSSYRDNWSGPAGMGYQPQFNSYSGYGGRIDTVEARTDLNIRRSNLLTAGFEFEREYYENPSHDQNPDAAQRVNAKASASLISNTGFVQDQVRLLNDRLQLSFAGRLQGFHLNTPEFEGGAPNYEGVKFKAPPRAWTGDASVAYLLASAGTKLRAHAGNGYRSPALYERFGSSFFWGLFSPLGDPRLRPERTVSADFGFDHYFANSRYRISGTYFYSRLRETIVYASLENDPYGRWGGYVNAGGGLARGVEFSLEARPHRNLHVNTSYTYTNADEHRSSLVGGALNSIRVFPHMFTMVAQQQVTRRVQVSVDFLGASDYVSGSFFVGSGNRPYLFSGPRKLDVAASYTLPQGETRSLRFFVRAENLLNQRYFEDGFRTPRIWAAAGVRFVF